MCVLPFKTKFLKKRDEEMKMKMRERDLAGGSFFKQCFVAEHKETKKKSLSPALSPNPKSTIILQNLFFAHGKYISSRIHAV